MLAQVYNHNLLYLCATERRDVLAFHIMAIYLVPHLHLNEAQVVAENHFCLVLSAYMTGPLRRLV